MSRITTLVFDLGGVLIDWNPDYLYRTIFTDEKERRHFLTEVCTPDWNQEQDPGRSLQAGTAHLLQNFPERKAPIRPFYERREQIPSRPTKAPLNILKHSTSKTSYKPHT